MIRNKFLQSSIYIKNILIDQRYDILMHFVTVIYTPPHSSRLLHAFQCCSTVLHPMPHSCTLLHAPPHSTMLLHTAPLSSKLFNALTYSPTLLLAPPQSSMHFNALPPSSNFQSYSSMFMYSHPHLSTL